VDYPRPGCGWRRQLVCRRALLLAPTNDGVVGGEMTVAQKGTIMNSTMVLSMDASGRTLWVDMGWPACDERLVTVAEANAHGVGGATFQLPDVRLSRRKK
jgi:hypothetical protein